LGLLVIEILQAMKTERAENKRLKLKLFYPVNEDAEPGGVRKNFQVINLNFEMCGLDLLMVNVGEYPGDATGESMRDAWIKVNENFAKIEKAVE
jgi:hypothetical protein